MSPRPFVFRWGRGHETFGEDPALTGNLTHAWVTGLRGDDPSGVVKVSAVCKHFAAYSLEEDGGVSRFWFNASVSEQDLEDTYLPAFKACVDSGADGVMASYNMLNVRCCRPHVPPTRRVVLVIKCASCSFIFSI